MKIEAIAHALPRCTVSNEEMTERVLTESKRHLTAHELLQVKRMLGAFFRTAGTRVRYFRADDESAWSLTTAAGTQALERAGRRPEEIDLLIYAGVGRGFLEPSTATVFHDLLGLQAATCFDVLDACAGWLRAMHVAQAHLRSGDYRRVMILTGEFNVREYGRFEIRSLGEIRHLFPTYTISEAATATIRLALQLPQLASRTRALHDPAPQHRAVQRARDSRRRGDARVLLACARADPIREHPSRGSLPGGSTPGSRATRHHLRPRRQRCRR
jgi:RNA-binding protein YhbY